MPQIDFYVLSNRLSNGRLILACRLAEKAFLRDHRVYIHAASKVQAIQLDDMLWTFRAGSFVPHCLHGDNQGAATPILIGCQEEAPNEDDVLINLAPTIPTFFEQFQRIVELVEEEQEQRAQARERYRFYRDRGYHPATHKLNL